MSFFRNRLSKILQEKRFGNRNRTAFRVLTEIGFEPAEARRMLIAGNQIRVRGLAKDADVTAPTIYAAVYGRRNNTQGKEILSNALNVPVPELFPEQDNG
jgi:rhodanese-related sulfurtransferase